MNYDNAYKIIIVNGKKYRFYDESALGAEHVFYIETKFKWLEFIEKYNFNIYIIKTTPKINSKIIYTSKSLFERDVDRFHDYKKKWSEKPHYTDQTFADYYFAITKNKCSTIEELKLSYQFKPSKFFEKFETIDFKSSEMQNIKKLQSEDLYYLYINILYEVLYVTPKKTNDGLYYYELIVILNKNIDFNKILNYNYNLINISNVLPVNILDITPNFIEKLFPTHQSEFTDLEFDLSEYPWNKVEDDFEETKILKENINLNWDARQNLKYIIWNKTEKLFNQNCYAKVAFKKMCFHVYSFDKIFFKCFMKAGMSYEKVCKYDMNFVFASNFYEIMGALSVSYDKNNNMLVKTENVCWNSMSLNYDVLRMTEFGFSKEFIQKGYIDFNNLETIKEEELRP